MRTQGPGVDPLGPLPDEKLKQLDKEYLVRAEQQCVN